MSLNKIRVAVVGTNGIPARYGGYETLVEYLTKYLSSEFSFTVYCSKKQSKTFSEYNNSKLIYVPLNANGWQSIVYDTYTLFVACFHSDVILYLGPGAGFVIPFLKVFRRKIIVNHGGLNEWQREKYSKFQKLIAKWGHKYSSKFASFNIADNILLKESINHTFDVDSIVIRYGGDHAIKEEIDQELINKYPFLSHEYYVNVSRAQVDNNLHMVLKAFEGIPNKKLVIVSNWSVSDYGIDLKNRYQNKFSNIVVLDAVYVPKEINAIRGNAIAYIHSHSYCGTSPSLVEAMSLGLPILSYDVPTNRETTQGKAFFFRDENVLNCLIDSLTIEDLMNNGKLMKGIAEKEYTWKIISAQYAELFRN